MLTEEKIRAACKPSISERRYNLFLVLFILVLLVISSAIEQYYKDPNFRNYVSGKGVSGKGATCKTDGTNPDTSWIGAESHGEVVINADSQSHYFIDGTINNYPVIFLVDTGATNVVIPEFLAKKIGLQKGQRVSANTANGSIAVYKTTVLITVGTLSKRTTAIINPNGSGVLLGMSFLKNFKLMQEHGKLTISL